MTVEIRLTELVLDDALQPRVNGLDAHYLSELRASDPADWTRISVIRLPGGKFQVIDGFHRVVTALALGLPTILAEVLSEVEDPQGRAFALNLAHGLRLTCDDRKAEAIRLRGLHPEMSNRAIASAVGLHHKTVDRLFACGAERQAGEQGISLAPDLDRMAQTLVRQTLKLYDAKGLLTRTATHDSHIAQAVAGELEYQFDGNKGRALSMARHMVAWTTQAVELLEQSQ